jgi:hypothetical protein
MDKGVIMSSFFKNQIISIIIVLTFMFIPAITIAEKAVTTPREEHYTYYQEPVEAPGQLIPVNFYMHPNNELTPQQAKEGKSDSFATCPNGFVPARWSIFKRFGSTEWKDVGTWATIQINKPLKAAGIVKFKMWVTYTGSGSPTGTFDFIWMRNNENIAEARNQQIGFTSGMSPALVEASAPLINQTPFEAGDTFSLYIRCRNNFDGAQFLYGSQEHASAVIMNCDPIELVEVMADKSKLKGYYDDVFAVKPAGMTFEGIVDNVVVDSIPEINSEHYNEKHYRTITWKKKIDPGEHSIEVRISYGGMDNTTVVNLMKQIEIKEKPEPTIFGIPALFFYIIVAVPTIIMIIAVGIKIKDRYEERKWYQQQEQDKQNY